MEFWVGITGVVVGVVVQIGAHIVKKLFDERKQHTSEKRQKQLLVSMLERNKSKWRRFETLSRVIGANDETTRRLLIEIGARGNELDADVWALIENKPLPDSQ